MVFKYHLYKIYYFHKDSERDAYTYLLYLTMLANHLQQMNHSSTEADDVIQEIQSIVDQLKIDDDDFLVSTWYLTQQPRDNFI